MNAVPDNGWDAVAKFDRAIAGTQGAFPYTSDNERIHEIIRDAGKHGLTWPSRAYCADFGQLSNSFSASMEWPVATSAIRSSRLAQYPNTVLRVEAC